MILMDEAIEKLKQEAVEAGFDIPEEPVGLDEVENVAEPEVIEYGDVE